MVDVFENPLPDIPRALTALTQFCGCGVFVLILKKRLHGLRLVGTLALALLAQEIFLIATDNVPLAFWIPCMLFSAAMQAGCILLCCEIKWREAVYCGIQAFIAAEFASSLGWQLYCFYFYASNSVLAEFAFLALICGCVFLLMWFLFRHGVTEGKMPEVGRRDLLIEGAIALAFFCVSNISFVTQNTPFSTAYGTALVTIRTVMDLGGVALLYAHFMQLCEFRSRLETEIMRNVVRNQYLQYKQSRESIEVLNYKYHDMKHQIAVLRQEEDPQKRRAFLDKMEEVIHNYEMQNKTGNSVVDTILTGKNAACEKNHITFSCVVDGKLLDFMEISDICSILGNALDNAIECEKKIADEKKRLIHMAVFSQKNFVILRFENYFDGTLSMEAGIPATTKKKKEFHGYGIKSIRYTVRKYGGAVSIDTRDNWFELKVLLPMAEGSADIAS